MQKEKYIVLFFVILQECSKNICIMELKEAIIRRHSVRQYVERSIETDKVERLRQVVNECNTEGNLHIQLITDEPQAFGGRWAHYGKFSGVSNYFAMIGRKDKSLDERIGYYGERLVLEAQRLGLNTCWVGLTYSKVSDVLAIDKDETLVCVISLGYGASQGTARKSKTPEQVSKNATSQPLPQWFRDGVEMALLAPTAMNQQKFRFTLLDGTTVKAEKGIGFYSGVDLGIVKLHFELGAGRENFTWQ